jgi:deoxycytidylate deaminase
MTTITSIEGDFTAKISLEPDFSKPDLIQVFEDIHGFQHFSAIENANEHNVSRTIYFTMKPGITNGKHIYPAGIHEMYFIDYKDHTRIKAKIISGECTVNFDHQKNRFTMSFHTYLKNIIDNREIDILGNFDLTQTTTDTAK